MLTIREGSRIKIILGLRVEHGVFKKVTLKTDTMMWLVGAQRWGR